MLGSVLVRLFEKRTLVQFGRKHPDAREPLRSWAMEIKRAHYENPTQVRQRHGACDFVGDKIIFDICGNKYRIIARLRYATPRTRPPLNGMLFILFIGTHAQYKKLNVASL
jgi:mRNA interferase HigB